MDEVLSVNSLTKRFPTGKRLPPLIAVDGVDLVLGRGECVALVGESGCGKTTLARVCVGLDRADDGTVVVNAQPVSRMTESQRRRHRRDIQYIFQDAADALNPRMRIRDIIGEAWRVHGLPDGTNSAARALQDALDSVGLAAGVADQYPAALSGGQKQRVAIARALAPRPRVLICDEITSSLDVSVQAQILELIKSLQKRFELALLFISHDLAVVRSIADRVVVMYQGRIVEQASATAVFEQPAHPYTRALLAASPEYLRTVPLSAFRIGGDGTATRTSSAGCVFSARCPVAREDCFSNAPPAVEVAAGHSALCRYADASIWQATIHNRDSDADGASDRD
jgi:oligopeptide/dipeptide ABC transporter ATP-binding protein